MKATVLQNSHDATVRLDRIYLISRIAIAIVFFYHGLVPKIWFRTEQEVLMNSTFAPGVDETFALLSSGVVEIVFSILFLLLYRVRLLNYAVIVFGTLATIAIAIQLPTLFTLAFNPFSTNLAIVVLAIINLLSANNAARPTNEAA